MYCMWCVRVRVMWRECDVWCARSESDVEGVCVVCEE